MQQGTPYTLSLDNAQDYLGVKGTVNLTVCNGTYCMLGLGNEGERVDN